VDASFYENTYIIIMKMLPETLFESLFQLSATVAVQYVRMSLKTVPKAACVPESLFESRLCIQKDADNGENRL
jgi:hypothetical protein